VHCYEAGVKSESAMIHDDVDDTASITFDETKVKAKIERVSKAVSAIHAKTKSIADSRSPTTSFSTKPSTSPTSTAPAKLKSSAGDVIKFTSGTAASNSRTGMSNARHCE